MIIEHVLQLPRDKRQAFAEFVLFDNTHNKEKSNDKKNNRLIPVDFSEIEFSESRVKEILFLPYEKFFIDKVLCALHLTLAIFSHNQETRIKNYLNESVYLDQFSCDMQVPPVKNYQAFKARDPIKGKFDAVETNIAITHHKIDLQKYGIDICFVLSERISGYALSIVYNSGYYSETTMRSFYYALEKLLEAIERRTSKPVNQIQLVSEKALSRLYQWGAGKRKSIKSETVLK